MRACISLGGGPNLFTSPIITSKMNVRLVLICQKAFSPISSYIKRSGRALFSERCLLYTNTGLSVGLSIAGDLLQQNYQMKKNRPAHSGQYDYYRTGKMAASGLVIGPFIHYWYVYLDRLFPGRCWRTIVKKLVVDQLICSPVCVALFLVTIGVLDGQGSQQLKDEFKDTGVTMYLTDLFIWTPAQAVNFYFLPTRYRVLFDSAVALAMDTFFSYLRFDHPAPQHVKHNSDDEDEPKLETEVSETAFLNENQSNAVNTVLIPSHHSSHQSVTFLSNHVKQL